VTFQQFYHDVYFPRHADRGCRLLHAAGPIASLIYAAVVIQFGSWWLLLLTPVPSYFFAWLGHAWANNKPAFFEHPVFSTLGFWKMMGQMLTSRVPRTA